jgi:hypothetical protein
LKEKLQIIEIKLNGEEKKARLKWGDYLEHLIVKSFFCFIGVFMIIMISSLTQFEETVLKDLESIRKSFMINSRLLLEAEVIQMVNGTSSFPHNMCESAGIPNLTSYTIDAYSNDITYGYDNLVQRINLGLMNP